MREPIPAPGGLQMEPTSKGREEQTLCDFKWRVHKATEIELRPLVDGC